MDEESRPNIAVLNRAVLFSVGAVLIAAGCALGVLVHFQAGVLGIDVWWNGIIIELASPLVTGLSRVMNFLGAGWFGVILVPVLGTVGLFLLRRPWSAVYFLAAEFLAVAFVQLLKQLFGRARPEDILVLADYGSFPSGHAANAATLAAAAFLLFPRLWVAIVGATWMLVMAFSRTGLHAHWLSDTIGGMLVGVGVAVIVAGILAPVLQRERAGRQQVA